jgi:hypothetical protein
MIDGAHIIIYSKDAEADRVFLRDVVGFSGIDVGHGWFIFKLPPSEMAVHPSDENDKHELFLMCSDLDGEIARLNRSGCACDPVSSQGWGRSTRLRLPGGGQLGLYEPRHERP